LALQNRPELHKNTDKLKIPGRLRGVDTNWYAIFALARRLSPSRREINNALKNALSEAALREKLAHAASERACCAPEEPKPIYRRTPEKPKLIRAKNIKPE
jgi:hypothetical protein